MAKWTIGFGNFTTISEGDAIRLYCVPRQLAQRIASALNAEQEGREDAERINWLESQGHSLRAHYLEDGTDTTEWQVCDRRAKTPREAIDFARTWEGRE